MGLENQPVEGVRPELGVVPNLVSSSSGPVLESRMAAYQAGDFSAASALIQQLSPQLHRFFLKGNGSQADADDLLQETWMRIHKVRHTYRPGEPVMPWFYAIARRVRVDHYRKTSRIQAFEEGMDDLSEFAPPDLGKPHQGPNLEEMLESLPESQREVIQMLKVAEMTLEEVARATSSTVGSVKQKVHRGYEKLRLRLAEFGPRQTQGRNGEAP